jgi:hypothetical protein
MSGLALGIDWRGHEAMRQVQVHMGVLTYLLACMMDDE